MVINPISVQGEITRAQDLSKIKHNQDNKVVVEQLNIQKQQENQTETKARQVQQKDETENEGKRHDAKDKGNNQYAGDGGRNRHKEQREISDGKVVLKGQKSFDIKV